ncbi:MAG: dehydrogenase [Methanosarcinales archaeon]|nr:dehydrogenase [Methanosarcinales archaeon]
MVKIKTMILALLFLAALIASISMTPWVYQGTEAYTFTPAKEDLRVPESGIGDVGIEIFTIYVFPFEVLALVLLASLIGAVYVARKEIA